MSDLLEQLIAIVNDMRGRVAALEQQEMPSDADTVDGYHAADLIDTDADTVDGYHAADLLGTKVNVYTNYSSTAHIFTAQSYTDIPDISRDVSVQAGDVIIATITLATYNVSASRGNSVALRLSLGGSLSQALAVCSPSASYWMPMALTWAVQATASGTWTVKPQVYVYYAGDTVYTRYERLVVTHIRQL